MTIYLVAFFVAALLMLILMSSANKRRREQLLTKLRDVAVNNIESLAKKRCALANEDASCAYGGDEWKNRLEALAMANARSEIQNGVISLEKCLSVIDELVLAWQVENSGDVSIANQYCEKVFQDVMQTVDYLVNKHISVLATKRRRGVAVNEYGIESDIKWVSELNEFYHTIVVPEVGGEFISATEFKGVVDNMIASWELSNDVVSVCADEMTGFEYEEYCAQLFRAAGTIVTGTPATGDHGADLLVKIGSKRVAVQCKRYSSNVGNKAVQEVVSAIKMYGADSGIVVSNSGFTRSAQETAAAHHVHLLNHEQIGVFVEEMTGEISGKS